MNKDLKSVLDELAARYNASGFAEDDPIQFPKRYDDPRDIEISAFLISIISWGRRPMILRNGERMHQLLGNQPYRFVMEGNIDTIPEDNVHRTFFGRHLRYALRGLRTIYRTYGSLEAFGSHEDIQHAEAPAWELAKAINRVSAEADSKCIEPLEGPTRCLPDNVDNSALKRLNMALRWLVRDDGIIDIGTWKLLKPSQLYIPLDVHSGNTARALGLLSRKANDRRAVVELTEALRRFNPDDPVLYDFALFGAGEAGIIKPKTATISNSPD